jgi:hypothetical protein
MSTGLWDILVTSIPHRHATLLELLAELGRQQDDLFAPGPYGAGVLVYRDNLEVPYGDKTRVLLETSDAEYVSCIDDDDLPCSGYLSCIWAALAARPDYVGYPVRWFRNGTEQIPVEHSLRHASWSEGDGILKRDISEKNPVRREIALAGGWEGGYGAESRWADKVRASGKCVTEAWIGEPMYCYRENTSDTFQTQRSPWPEPLPELPSYPWLTVLGR